MKRNKRNLILASLSLAALVAAGCAALPSSSELDAKTQAMLKASFRDEGIAKLDRLQQDLGQSACSSDKAPSDAVAEKITAEALASVKWPTGGRYFGSWQEGEKLAQDGSGMTWRDKSTAPKENGGSCYNCHQLSKEELSYGTIGPSLYNYGKNRGVRDLMAATSKPIIDYTWAKIYNSKSYNACSNMPRFGHAKLLDESQIADVMSLLLDPKSPVNQ